MGKPLPVMIDAFVNSSAIGNTELVAAFTYQKIRVFSMAVVTTNINSVKFQSATTDISALFPFGANGGMILPFNEKGWFETEVNEALNVNLSVATVTGIQIVYALIN